MISHRKPVYLGQMTACALSKILLYEPEDLRLLVTQIEICQMHRCNISLVISQRQCS